MRSRSSSTSRRLFGLLLAGITVIGVDAATALAGNGAGRSKDQPTARRTWPRSLERKDGTVVVMYQPQIERWEGYRRLEALAAVSIRVPGRGGEILGAVTLEARTETDHAARLVTLRGITVTDITYPGPGGDAVGPGLTKLLQSIFPKGSITIELDRVLANLRGVAAASNVEISTDPPKIILTERDGVLVAIDGAPIYMELEGTPVELIVNTSSNVFRDPATGKHYLLRGVHWLEAPELTGPWTVNRRLPEPFFRLPRDDHRLKYVRLKVRARSIGALADPPDVFVATEPTELIAVYGEPELEPIPGTALKYVTNSDADIFKYADDGYWYAVLSGRWFKTKGSGEPLILCTSDLPADFAKIPPDHLAGRVLVNVPGTQQAREAVLGAGIPRTATIVRSEAEAEVTYVGEPKFGRIAGTEVSRAINTSADVFRVHGRYYLCHQAVWFVGDAPDGPWEVCDDVPEEIYTIPPSDPAHAVTYVRVYDADEDEVVCGYLPGYEGVCVADDVLVYGLGFDYDYPESYYIDRYNAWARGARYIRLRHTYGHGHYYDHLMGRYNRSELDLAHASINDILSDPYTSWYGAGVVASRYNARLDAPGAPAVAVGGPLFNPVAGRRQGGDLYAARNGTIYRQQGGNWHQYGRGGWSGAGAQPPAGIRYSASARPWGINRQSQYRRYANTRGGQTVHRQYIPSGYVRRGRGSYKHPARIRD
jgi:hypothetical protein